VNIARLFFRALVVTAVIWPVLPTAAAETGGWTLESATQRVLEVAPERRAAEADIAAREGELVRDTAWPNPTVEGRADRKLGIEDGTGGSDVTQLAVTQPLPLLRLSRQRAQAEANLAAAQAGRHYRRLLLENQAARAFHQLQLAEAKRTLARERAEAAQQYAETGGTDSRLVRYLSPLDRTRLAILRESARQAFTAADGEWSEAATRFRALLALPGEETLATGPLNAAVSPPSLSGLKARLDAHPVLIASQRELDAARAGIDVARSSRFADPTLTLFRERDILGGSRRDYNGVMLGVQIPLWNLNRGGMDRAAAEASRAEATTAVQRRDLGVALRDSHLKLARLVQQAEHYRANVLEPSRRFLDLTRRSFAAGEANILALVDANNVYFDAAQRHLELLAEGHLTAADLRLATGQSVSAGEAAP